MKFSSAAIFAATFVFTGTAAVTTDTAFVGSRHHHNAAAITNCRSSSNSAFIPRSLLSSSSPQSFTKSRLTMSYTVGIVGATGAVGKEIRQVLEKRGKIPISALRIFGSERSAGKTVDTGYGPVQVELFNVAAARECDVCFLAVSGEFALEHAKAMSEGEDGCVVIDNSVRSPFGSSVFGFLQHPQ
jgi:Semialdehyde dehydrogenase, NAD binding domain